MGASTSHVNNNDHFVLDTDYISSPTNTPSKKSRFFSPFSSKKKRGHVDRQREQQLSPPTSPMVKSPPPCAAARRLRKPWSNRLQFTVNEKALLGNGTFADVVEATATESGAHFKKGDMVACKLINKSSIPDEMRYVITEECNIISTLSHNNIIRIFSAYENASQIFLFMELMSGGDLHSFIEDHGRLPEFVAWKIFTQLVDALCHCHEKNVIHRDIKLENILLKRNNKSLEVALVDFGFATTQRPTDPKLDDYPGSPAYAAPELTKGIPYQGRKSDVWALGVTLYTMVCGQYPFWSEDMDEMYYRIANVNPSFRSSWNLTSSLRLLLNAMLSKNPAQRPSMEEIASCQWIKDFQPSQSVPKPIPTTPRTRQERPRPQTTAKPQQQKATTQHPSSPFRPPKSPFSKAKFKAIGRHFSSPLKKRQAKLASPAKSQQKQAQQQQAQPKATRKLQF